MFLTLNGNKNSIDKLNSFEPSTEFEKETVKFIQDWLNKKQSFYLTTSGSTGTPKPITIPRYKMELSAKATIQALRLPKSGIALVCLNTKFIAGKMMLARALINNMDIIAVEPTAIPFENMEDFSSIDLTAMVPLQMENILNTGQFTDNLNRCKAILLGGGPVSTSLKKRLQNIKSEIYATYGMTETISHIAIKRLNGLENSLYFKTLPNIEIEKDSRGCLTINSELTDYKTLITNDLVDIKDNSTFEWLGRYDNVINTGGIKVQSEKIESTIEELFNKENIENRFFCYGLPNEKLGQKIILIIEGRLENASNILDEIKKEVPKYHAPRAIYSVSNFIETATKKIQRKPTVDRAISSPPLV